MGPLLGETARVFFVNITRFNSVNGGSAQPGPNITDGCGSEFGQASKEQSAMTKDQQLKYASKQISYIDRDALAFREALPVSDTSLMTR